MMKRIALFLSFLFLITEIAAQTTTGEIWLAPACRPKLYGLQDEAGVTVLPAQYDFLYEQEGNTWIVISGIHFGVVNAKGEWILKPEYEMISQYLNGRAIVSRRVPKKRPSDYYGIYERLDSVSLFGIVDQSGVWLVSAQYEMLSLSEDGSALYRNENDVYGFINADGSVLISAQYDYATPMSCGVAVMAEHQVESRGLSSIYEYDYYYGSNDRAFTRGDYYLVNQMGAKLNTTPYELLRPAKEFRVAFNKGGLWKNQKTYQSGEKLVGGKWGFLDINGTEIIPAQYDYVYDFEDGKAKVQIGDRVFWIDKDGKETSAPEEKGKKMYQVYCEAGSFGYLNLKGEWVIEPQYYAAHAFSEGLAAVMALRAEDQDCNKPELNDEFYDYGEYSNRLRIFNLGSRRRYRDNELDGYYDELKVKRRLYGYIDANGITVIEAKYDQALPFKNNRAYVQYRGKWGVIDRSGKWIMAPVLDEPDVQFDYRSNQYRLDYDHLYNEGGVSYNDIHRYDEPMETFLYTFSEGFGCIDYKGKCGFIDTTGKIIVAPVYDMVLPFSNGLAAVRHNDLWGYIDYTGKEVIPCRYYEASSFSANGLAAIGTVPNKSGLVSDNPEMVYEGDNQVYFGYIDKTGKWVIKPQFTYASSFSEGFAVASISYREYGYINEAGKFVIEPKYADANEFKHGYAFVKMLMYEGVYIDKSGKVSKSFNLNHPPIDKTIPLHPDINSDLRYGFVNEKGEEIIKHQYRHVGDFVKVKRN
jgi:WG containing repeat